jgi:TonB family protein
MTAERFTSTRPPYGALELKRAYQRGLVCAFLAATVIHIGAIQGARLYGHLTAGLEPDVVNLPPETQRDIRIAPSVKVEPEVVAPDQPRARVTRDFAMGRIRPMPDAEVDEEALFATRLQIEQHLDGLTDSAGGGKGGRAERGLEGIPDARLELPAFDSFIVRTREPEPLPNQPQPDYPEMAQLAGQEGWVHLRILVSERGEVLEVRSLDRPGSISELLVDAAKEAVWKWKFRPALQQDRNVATWFNQAFHFKLQ